MESELQRVKPKQQEIEQISEVQPQIQESLVVSSEQPPEIATAIRPQSSYVPRSDLSSFLQEGLKIAARPTSAQPTLTSTDRGKDLDEVATEEVVKYDSNSDSKSNDVANIEQNAAHSVADSSKPIQDQNKLASILSHPGYRAETLIAENTSTANSTGNSSVEQANVPELPLIDGYLMEKLLGTGGMGEVYLARNKLNAKVAVKILHDPMVPLAPSLETKIRELNQNIDHPHIIRATEMGKTKDGRIYMAMPYAGEVLSTKQERPLKEKVDIIRQVATLLGVIHKQNIVHKDIKEQNITLYNGCVNILDLDIAQIAQSSSGLQNTMQQTKTSHDVEKVMGTLEYMSPEQRRGESLDGRSDIYSLGMLFYKLLTNGEDAGHDVVTELTGRVDVAPELIAYVMPLLQKKKENRYQTVEKWIKDLDDICSRIDWKKYETKAKENFSVVKMEEKTVSSEKPASDVISYSKRIGCGIIGSSGSSDRFDAGPLWASEFIIKAASILSTIDSSLRKIEIPGYIGLDIILNSATLFDDANATRKCNNIDHLIRSVQGGLDYLHSASFSCRGSNIAVHLSYDSKQIREGIIGIEVNISDSNYTIEQQAQFGRVFAEISDWCKYKGHLLFWRKHWTKQLEEEGCTYDAAVKLLTVGTKERQFQYPKNALSDLI